MLGLSLSFLPHAGGVDRGWGLAATIVPVEAGELFAWRVVIPVKGGAAAKSRLALATGRGDVAAAFAVDTVQAAAEAVGAASTWVVCPSSVELPPQVHRVADPGTGLGKAIRAGLDAVGPGPVAVLLGDLPCLRAEDLQVALTACAAHDAAFVPDAAGTGTALLTSRSAESLHPAFGPESAAAHSRMATRLELDLPRLRQDVDTADDLRAALALGVGEATAAAIAAHAPLAP